MALERKTPERDVYKDIDWLSSFGLLTTVDIAQRCAVTEATVANYLAAKRAQERPDGKVGLVAQENPVAALRTERRKRTFALARRATFLENVRLSLEASAGRPECYADARGAMQPYKAHDARLIKMEAGRLMAEAEKHNSRGYLKTWGQHQWASLALDFMGDAKPWQVAAIAKHCYSLTQGVQA